MCAVQKYVHTDSQPQPALVGVQSRHLPKSSTAHSAQSQTPDLRFEAEVEVSDLEIETEGWRA